MKRMFKFPLMLMYQTDEIQIRLPAEIKNVMVFEDVAYIYAITDDENNEIATFKVLQLETGVPIPSDAGEYLGTIVKHVSHVIHVFVKRIE
jgi:hypothetical protein